MPLVCHLPLALQKNKSKKDHELPNTTRSKYPDPLPSDMSFIDSLTVSRLCSTVVAPLYLSAK